MSPPAPGVGGTFHGVLGGDLLFTYGPELVTKSAPLGGTGRAGSKTGYSCQGKSLRFSCRRSLPAWRHTSATVCEVRRFRGNLRLLPSRISGTLEFCPRLQSRQPARDNPSLQIEASTVYELTRRRSVRPLPALKVGRVLRFRWSDIEHWLNESRRT